MPAMTTSVNEAGVGFFRPCTEPRKREYRSRLTRKKITGVSMKITGFSMKVITAPRFVRLPSLVASAVFASLALGTGAAIAEESFQLEEVFVTARRVEESQQSVPVALTALSQNALDQQIVLDVRDLQTSMPGLLIATDSTGGQPTFAIRGAKKDFNSSTPVAVYIDDVPVWSSLSVANMVYDMQSITMLRGPQGTYFGANSTGGAVVFRPNKPTDTFEGYTMLGAGDYSRKEFQGMVNLPVNDMLQLRLAGDIVRRDGFVKNLTDSRELSDDEHESARLSVRLKLSDTLLNDTVVDYYHADDQPYQQWTQAYRPRFDFLTFLGFSVPVDWALAGVQPLPRFRAQTSDNPTWNKADNYGIANTTNWEVSPNWTLQNVIGYRKDSTDASQSQNDGRQFVTSDGRITYDNEQWTWEPSATVTWGDGRWTNKTGLFLLDTELRWGISYRVLGEPWDFTGQPEFVEPLVNDFMPLQANQIQFHERQSWAIYDQLSVALSDTLTFTAGVRYTKDDSKFQTTNRVSFATTEPDGLGPYGSRTYGPCDATSTGAYENFDAEACTGTRETDSDNLSFTLSIENQYADRKMIYASLRTGYLVGGFNNGVAAVAGQIFGPEEVIEFEGGLKADWDVAGRPLRTNVAVFFGTYEDQQRIFNGVDENGVTYQALQNAGSTQFYGADIDVIYAPSDYFELSLSYQRLIAEYTNYNATLSVPGITAALDREGEQLSQAPKDVFTASATLDWNIAPELGELSTTLSYFYRGDTFGADAPSVGGSCAGNTPETPVTRCTAPGTFIMDPAQDFTEFDVLQSFGIFNLTAQWNGIAGTKFDGQLWVKNLADEDYFTDVNNQYGLYGWASFILGDPRTYGLRLRYNF